jgi:hypothetical protein
MPANGLLMLAPVRPGEEQALSDTLNTFGNDIQGKRTPPDIPRIELPASHSIHFARFALLDDPARGPGRRRLLFATDYDGSLEEHLREIMTRTHRPEAIWGRLEGYTTPDQFAAFVQSHLIEPDAYYIAFRQASLATIRQALGLSAAFDKLLAEPDPTRSFPALPELLRIGRALQLARRWLGYVPNLLYTFFVATIEVIGLIRRLGFWRVLSAARRINATLNRVWWIRLFNFVLGNRSEPRPHSYSQADPRLRIQAIPPGYPPEDAVLQNQLTLLTDVAPEYLRELRAVLALIDLFGRRLSSPGSLVGISTIHTVRWALIDQGQRLLMVSNYDNTWENYIDEFAEMILSGLDALWRSARDFPQAGAQDVAALKQFLRQHQVPANAFYSAIPETSVLNIQQTLEFVRWAGPLIQRAVRDSARGGEMPAGDLASGL